MNGEGEPKIGKEIVQFPTGEEILSMAESAISRAAELQESWLILDKERMERSGGRTDKESAEEADKYLKLFRSLSSAIRPVITMRQRYKSEEKARLALRDFRDSVKSLEQVVSDVSTQLESLKKGPNA